MGPAGKGALQLAWEPSLVRAQTQAAAEKTLFKNRCWRLHVWVGRCLWQHFSRQPKGGRGTDDRTWLVLHAVSLSPTGQRADTRPLRPAGPCEVRGAGPRGHTWCDSVCRNRPEQATRRRRGRRGPHGDVLPGDKRLGARSGARTPLRTCYAELPLSPDLSPDLSPLTC